MKSKVHLYKMTHWKSIKYWYVNDVTNLTGKSAKWYTPMRILNLSIEEYVDLLVNTFHAEGLFYYDDTDFFGFYFVEEKDAKAFCSHVNKQARLNKYYCI